MWSRKGIIYVVSAPSGTGKTTICRMVLEEVDNIRFSVSYTTRSKRKGEVDGVDYYFVSRERFKELIEQDHFVEWAEVYGNYYGTPWSELKKAEEEGYDLLLEIDVQGGARIKEAFPDAVMIFLVPPSLEELERRLKSRGRDSEEEIRRRLDVARREFQFMDRYDYIVENRELREAVERVKCIIEAERHKRSRIGDRYREIFNLEKGNEE